jgi:hypothetical protein
MKVLRNHAMESGRRDRRASAELPAFVAEATSAE